MKLWLATSNPGKLEDFAGMGEGWEVGLMPGFAQLPGVEETGTTFEENARIKAEHYSRFSPDLVVADDSGLEVEALAGAPGVHSARYAGRHGDDEANNRLVLQKLRGVPPERRRAAFVCVLAVARGGKTVGTFSGRAEGRILSEARGAKGFGYDPLFYSEEAGRGFGEMERAEKARYSHRGRAARELMRWRMNGDQ